MRRVVITGMGMVTSLGTNVDTTWNNLIAGKSGLRLSQQCDLTDIPAKVAGEVINGDGTNGTFNVSASLDSKEQRKMDRFIQFAMVASDEAIKDSGWMPEDYEGQCETGVIIGSGIGGLQVIDEQSVNLEKNGARRVTPFFIPASLINLASGQVSIKYGFKGPNHSVVTACATGTHAIGDAMRLIQHGDAEVMVCGGAEAAINRLGMAGFAALRALSTGFTETPTKASRPFDKDRDGFVMGEGAGVLVLEELEHAKKRGAKIYAEVIGYGLAGDAYHMTSPPPDGDGAYRAMKAAVKNAHILPGQIDYINAHGTSTPVGDEIEFGAVKKLLGDDAHKVSMSSTKSAIGHLLGAAGAVEAIFCIKAITDGIMPPTLNLDNPSDACEGIDLVPHKAKKRDIKYALSNSFGFGGTNASVIFKAYK
jgi:3-oxoacyl-[acyl-carrier-protein] synthase II